MRGPEESSGSRRPLRGGKDNAVGRHAPTELTAQKLHDYDEIECKMVFEEGEASSGKRCGGEEYRGRGKLAPTQREGNTTPNTPNTTPRRPGAANPPTITLQYIFIDGKAAAADRTEGEGGRAPSLQPRDMPVSLNVHC